MKIPLIAFCMVFLTLNCEKYSKTISHQNRIIDSTINQTLVLNKRINFNEIANIDLNQNMLYDDWGYFSNIDNREYLAMQINFGGGSNEFKQFEVGYIPINCKFFISPQAEEYFRLNDLKKNNFKFIKLHFNIFRTESGIRLGITQKQLMEIIADKAFCEERQGENLIISYSDDDSGYEARYVLKNNRLIFFKFGYKTW
uniref:hypothetical protein n=1 Tax=Ornithobacterium rhinotracheale TaxID=28251 RepID=UPI001623ED43|nr:hypothetical protein [Ornithobacterium rhinotracheale]